MSRRTPVQGGDADIERCSDMEVVSRLAIVIGNTELGCECKETLNETLERFVALERRRIARRILSDARRQRDRIEAFLVFLKELDEVQEAEPDRTVFREMTLLFDDIAEAGRRGAQLTRQLSPPSS